MSAGHRGEGTINLRFFSRSGLPLGEFELNTVRDRGEEASVLGLYNLSQVRRVSPLAMWYLAAHASAPRLTVDTVVHLKLTAVLERLGMTWSDQDMTGLTRTVAQNAAAIAEEAGWILRRPEHEVPQAVQSAAGEDADDRSDDYRSDGYRSDDDWSERGDYGHGLADDSAPALATPSHRYISVREPSSAMQRWMSEPLIVPGIFDLMLEAGDAGLYEFRADGQADQVDIVVLVRLLLSGARPEMPWFGWSCLTVPGSVR